MATQKEADAAEAAMLMWVDKNADFLVAALTSSEDDCRRAARAATATGEPGAAAIAEALLQSADRWSKLAEEFTALYEAIPVD